VKESMRFFYAVRSLMAFDVESVIEAIKEGIERFLRPDRPDDAERTLAVVSTSAFKRAISGVIEYGVGKRGEDIEEVTQRVSESVLKDSRLFGFSYQSDSQLVGFFRQAIKFKVLNILRDIGVEPERVTLDEGGVMRVEDTSSSPAEEAIRRIDDEDDDRYLAEMKNQLHVYMSAKVGQDPILRDVYELWRRTYDPDSLFGQRQLKDRIVAPIRKKYDVSHQTVSNRIDILRNMYRKFFENVLHRRLTDADLKQMRLASSEEVVAYGEYVRRLAAWMLGVSVSC
jgi:hypothetical protein